MASPQLAVVGEGLVELGLDADNSLASAAPGGDAANIAVMSARLGGGVRLGGRLGCDPFGDWLASYWTGQGVDISHVWRDSEAPTGLYLNQLSASGEHEFVYWRRQSAGSRFNINDIPDDFLADVSCLVVTGVTLAVSESSAAAARELMKRAHAAAIQVACVLNHRAALRADHAELLAVARQADVVIGSSADAETLLGTADIAGLSKALPGVPELVLTAGQDNVQALVDGTPVTQPVPNVPVINAAGAGDAFAGAYLTARVSGAGPAEALLWGVAAAAGSVTRHGCARSYPSASTTCDVVQRLAEAR